jgi:hypothetical protein
MYKIFFTVSKTGRYQYSHINHLILDELRRSKVKVISTVDEQYLSEFPQLQKGPSLSEMEQDHKYTHDILVKRAILLCDAVIVEASHPSFRLGFEAHLALTQQKPVLVLSQTTNFGNLINHPNFFGVKYSEFTLPDEIEKFLRHVKKFSLRNRFNLFVSDHERDYLKQVSQLHGISMSSYIRKLIQQDNATTEKELGKALKEIK